MTLSRVERCTGTLAQVTLCRMFDTHNSFSLQIAS